MLFRMNGTDAADKAPDTNRQPVAAMRVLASGSSGNCSVLILRHGADRRVFLIDMGLSPRRTRRLLNEVGLSLDSVDHALITHFDTDHFYRGWASALPARVVTHIHERHAAKARKVGLKANRINAFTDSTSLNEVHVSVSLMAHDSAGVSAFRLDHLGVSLGYATDVGKPTQRLIDHLAGVDLLAIESNYCPQLQAESNRPVFLKQRIMGGAGHLSNQQCVQLAADIRPRSEVVLLHLSRQCNRPDLAAKGHHGASYRLTISSQCETTPWLGVFPSIVTGKDCRMHGTRSRPRMHVM